VAPDEQRTGLAKVVSLNVRLRKGNRAASSARKATSTQSGEAQQQSRDWTDERGPKRPLV
jgi:hypothetical protein